MIEFQGWLVIFLLLSIFWVLYCGFDALIKGRRR